MKRLQMRAAAAAFIFALGLCAALIATLRTGAGGRDGGRSDSNDERAEPGSASGSASGSESGSESVSGSASGSESGSESVSGSDSESGSDAESGSGPGAAVLVGDRIAHIAALAERRDVAALPWLQQSVLAEQPDLAPTIVLTVAKLAALAPDVQRDAAAHRLGEWLRAESGREGRDARGNVALLVEALAITGSPEGVDALTVALDAQRLPLHVETLAVQGLFELGDPRALPAVRRWSERVAELPRGNGLEQALRSEAQLAAQATLASLGS